MRVSGICSICGNIARPPMTCIICGATVCQNCFDLERGICKRCALGKVE